MDIQAAKARCKAASPGPWVKAAGGHIHSRAWGQGWVARANGNDAEFIAHARTDLPAVLEALEEAQGIIEAVKKEAHNWDDSECAWYCRMKVDAILGESE